MLGRRELELSINHAGKATPAKAEVQAKIAELYQTRKDGILVFDMCNQQGTNTSISKCRIYGSLDDLKKIELPYAIRRITGEVKGGKPRRARKDERKKKAKMFGSLKRNMKKAEKKNK